MTNNAQALFSVRLSPKEVKTKLLPEARRLLDTFNASEVRLLVFSEGRRMDVYSNAPPKTGKGLGVMERAPYALDDSAQVPLNELDDLIERLCALRTQESLRRILTVWGLNQSEAARRFGVSRQALSKWLENGIPTTKLESVADLAAATDVLTHYLKPDRIPAVIRRPIPERADKSLLDLLGEGKTGEILKTCRNMFDFQAVAC